MRCVLVCVHCVGARHVCWACVWVRVALQLLTLCVWCVTHVCACVCLVVAGNGLGDVGMVALAPALGKLVALTSLDLGGT